MGGTRRYVLFLLAASVLSSSARFDDNMMRERKRKKIQFWDNIYKMKRHRVASTEGSESATCVNGNANGYSCDAIDLVGFLSLEEMGCGFYSGHEWGGYANDIWGWSEYPGGIELAIVGCSTGTSFVDVTFPKHPQYVGFLPSTDTFSYWRDIKVYKDYAFIGAESASHGVQIISLLDVANDASNSITDKVYALDHIYYSVGSSHNLFINEDTGFLYILGGDECGGGLHIVDLSMDPAKPSFVACYDSIGYIHDVHCVLYNGPDQRYLGREICVVFSGAKIYVLDVEEKCNINILSSNIYEKKIFVHQGWLSEDHSIIVMGDEEDELLYGVKTRTLLWNASNLTNIQLLHDYRATTDAIDHNQYFHGGYIWQANYCAGFRVLKVLPSMQLSQVAHFVVADCGARDYWLGAWSNYPFLPSGHILLSSIEMGLFVLKPQFEVNASNGSPSVETANYSRLQTQCSEAPASHGQLLSTWPTISPTAQTGTKGSAMAKTVTIACSVFAAFVLMSLLYCMIFSNKCRKAKKPLPANQLTSMFSPNTVVPSAND